LSKRLGEEVCEFNARFHGLDIVALRIFNVYGLGQRPEFLIPTMVEQVLKGNEIRVMDTRPRRDYVYLEDVVEAFVKALNAPKGFHCVNIGSGDSYSVAEIGEAIQVAAGTRLPLISSEQARPQEIPDVRADIAKAATVLGWHPVWEFQRGISEVVKGFKS
jgi:nucleoside-diphosphate-sugar epimerase